MELHYNHHTNHDFGINLLLAFVFQCMDIQNSSLNIAMMFYYVPSHFASLQVKLLLKTFHTLNILCTHPSNCRCQISASGFLPQLSQFLHLSLLFFLTQPLPWKVCIRFDISGRIFHHFCWDSIDNLSFSWRKLSKAASANFKSNSSFFIFASSTFILSKYLNLQTTD